MGLVRVPFLLEKFYTFTSHLFHIYNSGESSTRAVLCCPGLVHSYASHVIEEPPPSTVQEEITQNLEGAESISIGSQEGVETRLVSFLLKFFVVSVVDRPGLVVLHSIQTQVDVPMTNVGHH